jgi:hypothetical protein
VEHMAHGEEATNEWRSDASQERSIVEQDFHAEVHWKQKI